MSRYVINVFASQDLNEIADYFAENNLEAGERLFRAFNRKCQQLVAFPDSGKSYAAIRPGLRGLSLEGYIIFYRILDDDIEILRGWRYKSVADSDRAWLRRTVARDRQQI